jgi:hypothetical protein
VPHTVQHTFFFEEGSWKVEGEHRDAAGAASAVAGENAIRHEPGLWHFEAVLRLRGDPLRVTHNRYQIEPFSPGASSTHWSSNNPVLGALRGRFIIVGDSILSSYFSPSLRYRGFECIQQRDARRYSVRGAMLEEDKLISTWALELARI